LSELGLKGYLFKHLYWRAVNCQHFPGLLTISYQPSAISHQLSAMSHQPSAISHQPSAISHQPSAISHQP